MNGQSLLGVKLSEAQSYLVKSSDQVHMVVCDGFNVPAGTLSLTPQTSISPSNSLPFPTTNSSSSTPVVPPVTLPKPVLSHQHSSGTTNGHGGDRTDLVNGSRFSSRTSVPSTPTTTLTSAQCNYDNLRDIEGVTDDYTTVAQLNSSNGNGCKPPPLPSSSLPITDKSLMNNILNKTTAAANSIDPKSQSMFTANNNQNNQAAVRNTIFNN